MTLAEFIDRQFANELLKPLRLEHYPVVTRILREPVSPKTLTVYVGRRRR